MRSRELESRKKLLFLSKVQEEILHGVLLGDAHLEWSPRSRNPRIEFEQSAAHKDYLFHLFDVFRAFVEAEPRSRVQQCSSGVICESFCFHTVSHPCFRFFAQQYLRGNCKVVPKLIHRWLSPRCFAYWFMDDGSIKSKESKGVLLNTQAFSKSEVERLSNEVQHRLGLQTTLRPQSEGFQIYISGKSYERLVELLDPWVIESLRYKIPPARRT